VNGQKLATGHFFRLNPRDHHLDYIDLEKPDWGVTQPFRESARLPLNRGAQHNPFFKNRTFVSFEMLNGISGTHWHSSFLTAKLKTLDTLSNDFIMYS